MIPKHRMAALLLAVLALIAGVVWHAIASRSFPGRFVIAPSVSGHMVSYESRRLREFQPSLDPIRRHIGKSPPMPIAPDSWELNQLTTSPDGKMIAYLKQDFGHSGYVASIGLRRIDAYWETEMTFCQVARYLKLQKYRIRFSPQSNLQWSPDGTMLALADYDLLYIIDVRSGAVRSGAIPHDQDVDEFYQRWQAYNKSASLPKPLRVPGLGRFFDRDRQGYQDINGARLWERPVMKADAHERYHPAHLSADAKNVMWDGEKRIRMALGVDPNLPVLLPTTWQSYQQLVPEAHSDVISWHRVFSYGGRALSWVSQDTIYCDNWKLRVTNSGSGKLNIKATKTPLPCTFYTHPYWNPVGDKAAYILDTSKMHSAASLSAQLIVVDSDGKVIWRQQVQSCPGTLRWSQDGRYIALVCFDREWKLAFQIHEVGTLRCWKVPVPDEIGSEDGNLDPLTSGWDWDL